MQKNELQNQLESKNKQLAIFFIYTGKELPLLTDIIEKLKAVLLYLNDVLKEEEK